jgi:hypothetical protein
MKSSILSRGATGRLWPLVCAVAVLGLLTAILVGRKIGGGWIVDDDANYYLLVARNIAATGTSTFDGQSLTNGYHPLWLALLVLQDLTVGPSTAVTLMIQVLFYAGGVYLVLRRAASAPALALVAFTVCFATPIGHFGLGGMELSLLVLCFGLFVTAMAWARDGDAPVRGLALGLAAAACVAARIDSAVFIAPALAVAPVSRKGRVLAFGVLAVFGAVYAAYNLSMFGALLPLSSAVKALGGLQVNHRLLAQLGLGHDHRTFQAPFLATSLMLIASPALIPLSRPHTLARALAVASVVGGWIYLARLVFMSSWAVWPWYNFAMLFPMTAALYAAPPWIEAASERLAGRLGPGRIGAAALALCIAALAGLAAWAALVVLHPPRWGRNMEVLNRLAIRKYGAALGGARVAMGDRSGSFAMAYAGPLVQLEGLVNDKAYFDTVKAQGDVQGLLCRRRVRYVIDYQPDLGAYDHLRFSVMRPALTQFRAPALDVWRSDELGHFKDLGAYDSGEGNDTLYIWRLRCPPDHG